MILLRRPIFCLPVGLMMFCGLPGPSHADTVILKSGEIRSTVVDRFSDGAFWVRDGKKIYIIQPDEILKIVFTRDTEVTLPLRPEKILARPPGVRSKPAPASRTTREILSIPSAAASSAPSEEGSADTVQSPAGESEPELAILNYTALLNSGIFQIVGEIENRSAEMVRYVKVSVFLMDESGAVIDQNFSFVNPDPPHLKPDEKKAFKVSFLNPPKQITKYKIRVESSRF